MTFPITEQPTWAIRDSSKLDTYLDCPRQYFFSHMLGWRVDAPTHDAYFGESWHKSREHQLLHGYGDIKGAFEAFTGHYRLEFPPETDNIYTPKDPTNVFNALIQFAADRQSDLLENEVVELDGKKMTEISGTVPVDENRVLYYRMDSIMRRKADGKIFSWDHKSTKRMSRQWRENFHLSIQNGTYTHCLYCMFPIEDVLGVEFCGTMFEFLKRGSKNREAGYHVTFERIPAFKTPDQMNVWLWNVIDKLDDIDRETERLFHCKEEDAVLMAFPMNTNSCTKYWGCAFHDYCLAWSNPLQQAYEPPIGFRVEFWNPAEMKTSVKKDLEWQK